MRVRLDQISALDTRTHTNVTNTNKVSYRTQIARQHLCHRNFWARAEGGRPWKFSSPLVWAPCEIRLVFLKMCAHTSKVPIHFFGFLEDRKKIGRNCRGPRPLMGVYGAYMLGRLPGNTSLLTNLTVTVTTAIGQGHWNRLGLICYLSYDFLAMFHSNHGRIS